jgi:hypothetical protein
VQELGESQRRHRLELLACGSSTHPTEREQVTYSSLFVFTTAEQVAIRRILREFPEAAQTLEASLKPILEMLVQACRGIVRSEGEAEYVLAGLTDRIVGRTIIETDTWDEADDLRTSAIDLLTRHLLAQVRDEFVRYVLPGGALE